MHWENLGGAGGVGVGGGIRMANSCKPMAVSFQCMAKFTTSKKKKKRKKEKKKSRNITLPTKVCLIKAMDFPVVMYGCESWTEKKAES